METQIKELEKQYAAEGDTQKKFDILKKLAGLYVGTHNYLAVLNFMEEFLALAEELKSVEKKVDVLLHKATALSALSQSAEAMAVLEQVRRLPLSDVQNALALQTRGSIFLASGNIVEAQNYFEKALAIHRRLGNTYNVGNILLGAGNILLYTGQYPQAFEYFMNAHEIGIELKDSSIIGGALVNVGLVYLQIGEFGKGFETITKALPILEEIGHKKYMSNALGTLGIAYYQSDNFEQAEKYFRWTLAIKRQINEMIGVASSLINLGETLLALGKIEQAKKYFNEAMEVCERTGNRIGISDAKAGLATIIVKENSAHRREGIRLLEESLVIKENYSEILGEAKLLISIGELYQQEKEWDLAEKALRRAIKITSEIEAKNLYSSALFSMYGLLKQCGEIEEAIEMLEGYVEVQKEVKKEEIEKKIHEFEIQKQIYFYERKQALAEEQVAKEQQRNEELETMNLELRKLNHDINELLGIVAHDLKNPLTGIQLSTQLLEPYCQPETEPRFHKHISRISKATLRMLSIIDEVLIAQKVESGKITPHFQEVNIANVLTEILAEAEEKIHGKDMDVVFDAQTSANFSALCDRKMTLQVFEQLISNAVKFSPFTGKILLRVTHTPTNR